MRPILAALAALAALMLAAPAVAQEDVTYRPTAGEFTVKVDVRPQPDAGVPTQAVSIERTDTGEVLACAAAQNDETVDVVVTVAAADLPAPVIGKAWENGDCSGQEAESVNTGELTLGPPAEPVLVE